MVARHSIDKASEFILQAQHLLMGGFYEAAGRDAYMAGFHAAMAFVLMATGKRPKTHSGLRTEFARLAQGDRRVDPEFTTFLGRSFNLKVAADYDTGASVAMLEAKEAIDQAVRMVGAIGSLLHDAD